MKEELRKQALQIYQKAVLLYQSSPNPFVFEQVFHALNQAALRLKKCGEKEDQQTILSWYCSWASIIELYETDSPYLSIQCYHKAEEALKQVQQQEADNAEKIRATRARAECFVKTALIYTQALPHHSESILHSQTHLRHRATEEWKKAITVLSDIVSSAQMEEEDARKYISYIQQLVNTSQYLSNWEQVQPDVVMEEEKEKAKKEAENPQKKYSPSVMLSQFAPHQYIDAEEKIYYNTITKYYPRAIEVLNIIKKTSEDYLLLLSLRYKLMSGYYYSNGFNTPQAMLEKAVEQCEAIAILLHDNPSLKAPIHCMIENMKNCIESYINLNYSLALISSKEGMPKANIERAIRHCCLMVELLHTSPLPDLNKKELSSYQEHKKQYSKLLEKTVTCYLEINGNKEHPCLAKAQDLLSSEPGNYPSPLKLSSPLPFKQSCPMFIQKTSSLYRL